MTHYSNSALLVEHFRALEHTLALRTAIELDLFTHIGAGANTIPRLAKAARASERGLQALCDHLAIHEHLDKRGNRYTLTINSRIYLTKSSPAYIGSAVQFLANDAVVAAFCQLRRTVQRGRAAGRNSSLDWAEYARAMAPLAQPVADFVAAALKVKSAGPIQVLDAGAGHGLYGLAVAAQNPSAEIFALDSPRVLKIAVANARKAGLKARFHPLPGDVLKIDLCGPYDVAIAANLAHHFDGKTTLRLFRKCRAALKPDGRFVLVDFILNPDRISPQPDASFALTLLATTANGRVYSFQEFSTMLRGAGFRKITRPAKGAFARSVIIATP